MNVEMIEIKFNSELKIQLYYSLLGWLIASWQALIKP